MADHVTEEQFAKDTLERYAGCDVANFHKNLLLTNFPRYVEYFAKSRGVPIIEGSMFKVAHCPKDEVSILDFKIGSPAAASSSIFVRSCRSKPACFWGCAAA